MSDIIEFFIKLIKFRSIREFDSLIFNYKGNIKIKNDGVEIKYKIYLEDENICIQIPKYSNDKFNCWLKCTFIHSITQKIYLVNDKYFILNCEIITNEMIKLNINYLTNYKNYLLTPEFRDILGFNIIPLLNVDNIENINIAFGGILKHHQMFKQLAISKFMKYRSYGDHNETKHINMVNTIKNIKLNWYQIYVGNNISNDYTLLKYLHKDKLNIIDIIIANNIYIENINEFYRDVSQYYDRSEVKMFYLNILNRVQMNTIGRLCSEFYYVFVYHFLEFKIYINILENNCCSPLYLLQLLYYLNINRRDLYDNIKKNFYDDIEKYMKSLEKDFKEDYMYKIIRSNLIKNEI
jgi:hypothetical protein